MTDFDLRGLLTKFHALNVRRQQGEAIEEPLGLLMEEVRAHVRAVVPTTREQDRLKELAGQLRFHAATVGQDQRAFYEEAINRIDALASRV